MRLTSGDLEATFAPEVGMVCHSLRHRGEELLDQRDGLEVYAKTGKTMGIPLLHPWANRLGAWEYDALGRHVDLDGKPLRVDPGTGLPMHGTIPRAWRVVQPGVAELDGASDAFPFAHTVRMEIELGETLRYTTTIEAHDGPVPVSFGFHPFLTIPGVPRADWHVEIPVTRRRDFPSGETEPVEPYIGPLGDRAYDDGYDERDDRPFVVAGGGRRIEVGFEAGFPFAQVFAPPANDLISFEPMTAPTDALRAGTFPVAEPGKPFRAVFSIAVH
jgi:galactose mutarotase-like enzyme